MLERLQGNLETHLPGILGALLILIIGWIVARIVRSIVLGVLKNTNIDERIGRSMNSSIRIDKFLAKLAYFIVLIYTLVLVLNHLGLESVLTPVTDMLESFLGYIPNVFAAGIIGYVGYILATLISEASGYVANGAQSLAERHGLRGTLNVSKLVRNVIFAIVFLPILIAALEALQIESISGPATEMFRSFLHAIPQILSAALIVGIAYIVGNFARTFVTDLLDSLGANQVLSSLNVAAGQQSNLNLPRLVGNLVFLFILATGIVAGVEKLEMVRVTSMLEDVMRLSGSVLFGGLILVIGNYISILVRNYIATNESSEWIGNLARYSVLFIFFALGISTMGIAEDTVNLIFGLAMGAIAVAFAISFGLGGRDAAGKVANDIADRMTKR